MRRRRRRTDLTTLWLWLCPLAALAAPRTGQSQSPFLGRASIDVGVATLRQLVPDEGRYATVTAPTVAGELRLDGRRLAMRAAAGGTIAADDRWSAQTDLAASWVTPATRRSSWELGAAATALRYRGTPGAASGLLVGRHHLDLPGGTTGIWGGASGGFLGRQRGKTVPLAAIEAGGWWRGERLRASLGASLQRARLDTIPVARPIAGAPPVPPLVALDVTGLAEWRTPRVEVTGTAALRRAPRQSRDLLGTAYASGALRLTPRVALTASGGSLAADPLRGFPQRRVATIGLRFALGAGARTRMLAPVAYPAVDVVVRDGRRVLRVRTAASVSSVDVRGDFTKWQPLALARVGDAWETPLAAEPGTLRVLLRLDAGAWMPPANLPSVEDEFGERAGLLVVP